MFPIGTNLTQGNRFCSTTPSLSNRIRLLISGKAGGVMSGMALIWAANVKGLKPAAKIVLIQLADFPQQGNRPVQSKRQAVGG